MKNSLITLIKKCYKFICYPNKQKGNLMTKETTKPTTEENNSTERTTLNLEDLRVGYVVGLTDEGQFVFQVFGKEQELVQLLGIHQHAGHRVDSIYNNQQMSGDRLIHEIGRSIADLSKKMDHLPSTPLSEEEPSSPQATP